MMFLNKKTALFFTTVILFLIIIKSAGLFNWYSLVTQTMEPTIQQGSNVFVSNIPQIKNDDLIIFQTEDFPGPVVFRAVGKEGDTVEIKDGVLFINGQKEKEIERKTLAQYKVTKKRFLEIKDLDKIYHSYETQHLTYIDTFFIATNQKLANSLNLEQNIFNKQYEEKQIEELYNEKWNRDNFGPLLIPEDKFFVLGDNRVDSYDSRYFGLLDKKDIIGKVLF